CLHHNNYPLAF
nr:immunoglobulin light chain junction region [Macaca mulatta]MOX25052.1 immunoglobulin light chain junction region [Macaca mulatta]MOX26879.1 immunoglobulin light chain junction region [Macaca mulatta]MOX27184.1 immunoglobulin light chain junction region [Macaca mulatta]